MKKEIWTTNDGRKLLIEEMNDRHILNTHRMLRDKLIDVENLQHFSCVFAPSEDSMAYDDFEEALDESYKRGSALYTRINVFSDEIKRRGLEPLEPRVKVERLKVKSVEYVEHGKIVEFEK